MPCRNQPFYCCCYLVYLLSKSLPNAWAEDTVTVCFLPVTFPNAVPALLVRCGPRGGLCRGSGLFDPKSEDTLRPLCLRAMCSLPDQLGHPTLGNGVGGAVPLLLVFVSWAIRRTGHPEWVSRPESFRIKASGWMCCTPPVPEQLPPFPRRTVHGRDQEVEDHHGTLIRLPHGPPLTPVCTPRSHQIAGSDART